MSEFDKRVIGSVAKVWSEKRVGKDVFLRDLCDEVNLMMRGSERGGKKRRLRGYFTKDYWKETGSQPELWIGMKDQEKKQRFPGHFTKGRDYLKETEDDPHQNYE